MRNLLSIGVLAALPMAALHAQDARPELQRAIVVEEQEHDLGQAEALYRKLLEHGALGDAERAQVALHLGRVLQRLGKAEEATAMLQRAAKAGGDVAQQAQKALAAQGQDGEREKELRAKARELVGRVLAGGPEMQFQPGASYAVYGIFNQEICQNLLWLGDAVVPEIVAALEPVVAEFGKLKIPVDVSNGGAVKGKATRGLLGLLWKYGGKQAQQFLAGIAGNDSVGLRIACVEAASNLERADMLPTLLLFLRDPDPEARVQQALLLGDSGGVKNRIPVVDLLAAAKTGSPALKAVVLRFLTRNWDNANHAGARSASMEQTVPLMREALASTDPDFGRSGQEFLFSSAITQSPSGIALLLREFPKLNVSNQTPRELPEVKAEDAMQLLPLVVDAARALGPVAERDSNRVPRAQVWLGGAARKIVEHADAKAFSQVMELIDLGYDVPAGGNLVGWLYGEEKGPCRFTSEQAEQVFARYDRAYNRGALLGALGKLDLPPTMWPLLRAKAEACEDPEQLRGFLYPVARTGAPEAAAWLLKWASRNEDWANSVGYCLVALARRTQAEPVRAAMRTLLLGKEYGKDGGRLGRLFLALASMGDMGVFEDSRDTIPFSTFLNTNTVHPYARERKSGVWALSYLLEENGDPPCGYTRQQVVEIVRRIAAREPSYFANLDANRLTVAAIPGEVLGEIGRQVLSYAPEPTGDPMFDQGRDANLFAKQRVWLKVITQRITGAADGDTATMRAWAERCLADKDQRIRYGILDNLQVAAVPLLSAAIEARLDDEDGDCAAKAAGLLLQSGIANDAAWLQRLIQHRFAGVRQLAIGQLATRLGAPAAAAVLPGLRDQDPGVRRLACDYFGAILGVDAVPDLLACLRDPEEEVRKSAADALQKIRFYQDNQAHWDRILHGVDASIMNATEKLLAQARPTQPKAQRLLAIRSLGDLGAPEALPFLIDWMTDTDADLAAAARAAIQTIHERSAGKDAKDERPK